MCVCVCVCVCAHAGDTPHDLPFSVGEVITIIKPCNVMFWYLGENSDGRRGVIPINFLEVKKCVLQIFVMSFLPLLLSVCVA